MKNTTLSKKSIMRKTAVVSGATLVSRVMGLIREALIARVLGAGMVSDAFLAAHKIPHFLRKIFAEGALTAAFVPTVVRVVSDDSRDDASRLMTLSFIFFEGILLALCTLIFIFAWYVIRVIVPGFTTEQIEIAVPFLRILIGLILFISSSALLTGALNAVNHFFVPAIMSIVLNIFFIAGLIGIYCCGFSVNTLCYFVVAGAFTQFLLHVWVYFRENFSLKMPDAKAFKDFGIILSKFLPSLIGMSVFELNLFIDTSLASFLMVGSISRVHYASRFMAIPVSIIISLATILLPHFSRISRYAPKRLSFYLFECSKLIYWAMFPITIITIYFSFDIFATLYVSKKFTIADAELSQSILNAFALGMIFFSVNKILINTFYALHDTRTPTIITTVATIVNVILNLVLMQFMAATGLALATTIGGIVQTVLFYYYLVTRHHFQLFGKQLWRFIVRASFQAVLYLIPCYILLQLGEYFIDSLSMWWQHLLRDTVVMWLWVGPLFLFFCALMYKTRKSFGLKLYFLD